MGKFCLSLFDILLNLCTLLLNFDGLHFIQVVTTLNLNRALTFCKRQSTKFCGYTVYYPYNFISILIHVHVDVFCDEDGGKLFSSRTVCPACDTDLPGKYDIVRVDLQPSEEYKSVS